MFKENFFMTVITKNQKSGHLVIKIFIFVITKSDHFFIEKHFVITFFRHVTLK